MANNTILNTASGGDIISDDQITTLNGATIATNEKVQRIKIAYGSPASATDVTLATPFPIVAPNKLPVEIADTQSDIHGQLVGVTRITQIVTKFFQQAPASCLNITIAGTGTTANGIGTGVFSTGTGTTASVLAQTPVTIIYSAQYEAWGVLSGAFTAPTSSASYQRLGLYNTIDGYSFGYNGLIFGLWTRFNSVDTFIAQTSWNKDVLSGGATSTFKSNGSPVALVPTNINMFRIRYGWYGAVNTYFEVYAPDGNWVEVHIIRTANTQASVNMTNPNLPMTVEVNKTASDATNLSITCGGWAGGVTAPTIGIGMQGQQVLSALNAALTLPTTSLSSLSFSITGTWVGTLSFQYSIDGLTWFTTTFLENLTGLNVNQTTVNNNYIATVSAQRYHRVIATAWTSGTATIVYFGSSINSAKSIQPVSIAATIQDDVIDRSARLLGFVTANEGAAVTSGVTVLQNATAATSNGTSLVVAGYGTAVLQITGTFVATINFEFSIDAGATWNPISATQIGAGDIFQSTTIPGSFRITCTALDLIRARVTWTSGTSITINGRASNAINASKVVKLASGINIFGKVGIDQTTQGTTNGVSVTSQPELVTTGIISTTDIVVSAPSGTGALLSGTSTAGSYVSASASGGNASVVIGVTGLVTGTIYYEGSADSTTGIDGNWVSLNMKQAGVINTQISSSATANGLYRGNTAGIRYIRMRSVGALTGTPAITLRLSSGVAGEFLFGSIPTGTNSIGIVTQQPITKNTQGTNGVTTQDLKDAGRNQVHYYTLIPVLSTATDTLQLLTGTKGAATVTATATPVVVTTGKTFRVTRLAATYISTAVSGYGIVRLRYTIGGVVTIAGNIAATLVIGSSAPTTANSTASEEAILDEGWEFSAGTGVGVSVQGFAAVTPTAVGYVLVSLTGYEY